MFQFVCTFTWLNQQTSLLYISKTIENWTKVKRIIFAFENDRAKFAVSQGSLCILVCTDFAAKHLMQSLKKSHIPEPKVICMSSLSCICVKCSNPLWGRLEGALTIRNCVAILSYGWAFERNTKINETCSSLNTQAGVGRVSFVLFFRDIRLSLCLVATTYENNFLTSPLDPTIQYQPGPGPQKTSRFFRSWKSMIQVFSIFTNLVHNRIVEWKLKHWIECL